jgi:hypothetical protein
MGEVKSAFGKRKTVASQAGFPEPNTPYDPTPMMSNIYARLMQQAQPIAPAVVPPVEKKNEVGFKALAKTLNPISLLSKIPVSSRLQYKEPNAKAKKEKKFEEEQYAQANEARAKIAGQEAEDVKNFLAASMQRNSLAGSPFMDEVMKRTIMKRLLENPAAINKLTKSQG